MLEGRTAAARACREEPDEWWSDRLGIKGFTPRKALQQLGTDVMRHHFHPDIWLAALERRILANPGGKFVITDCRFPNELACLRRLGAVIWWIRRGPLPSWWSAAKEGKEIPGVHLSETLWISTVACDPAAVEISNDGTLEDLYIKIKGLLCAAAVG
jgi:hypothetical protein